MSNWSITIDPNDPTYIYGAWSVLQGSATVPTTYAVPSSGGTATLPNITTGDTLTFSFDPDDYGMTFDSEAVSPLVVTFDDGISPMEGHGELRNGVAYTVTLSPDSSTATALINLTANAIVARGTGGPSTIKGSLNVSGN